jgi:hypothetical protein
MSSQPIRWAGVAAAAVAVTAIATAVVTAALTAGQRPLTAGEVDDRLAAATASPSGQAGPSSTDGATPGGGLITPTPATGDSVFKLAPGVVTVHCDGDVSTLVSWSPNPGFRADDPVRGPAAQVSVKFESDVAADYLVTATCAGGVAAALATAQPDDHGGRGGGGSGHS